MEDMGKELVGRKVFVVEDDPMVSMLIEELLSDIGCEVVATVSRFNEVLEKAESIAFDVAILDFNLNGKHTISIAEEFARRDMRFLFATGYALPIVPEALQKVPVLQKPFRHDDLARAIRKVLS
jgi:CheY-like chemotaxis protein